MHGFSSKGQPIKSADVQSPSAAKQAVDEASYVTSWVEGSLGCIKLNRPQALNAMTLGAAGTLGTAECSTQNRLCGSEHGLRVGMVEAHSEALKSLATDRRVGAILLEGTPQAFCAGVSRSFEQTWCGCIVVVLPNSRAPVPCKS